MDIDKIADGAAGRVLEVIETEGRINRDDVRVAIKITLQEHLAPLQSTQRAISEIEQYVRARDHCSGRPAHTPGRIKPLTTDIKEIVDERLSRTEAKLDKMIELLEAAARRR